MSPKNANIIRRKAELDIDFGSAPESKTPLFQFLEGMEIEKTDEAYEYYLKYYNYSINLMCEWAESVSDCFD